MTCSLVLASASPSRAAMLRQAGVIADIIPANIDEDAIKQKMAGTQTDEIALALASAKAAKISALRPEAYTIGADQILVCEGVLYDKPKNMAQAKGHLQALSGKQHELITAALVMRGGQTVWQHLSRPLLKVRPLSDPFIDQYLDHVGEQVLSSVGAYQLEGQGAQLFDQVEGDFFSILGLPLLPLLAFLRDEHIL